MEDLNVAEAQNFKFIPEDKTWPAKLSCQSRSSAPTYKGQSLAT